MRRWRYLPADVRAAIVIIVVTGLLIFIACWAGTVGQ